MTRTKTVWQEWQGLLGRSRNLDALLSLSQTLETGANNS